DPQFNFYSMNFAHTGVIPCSLSDLSFNQEHDWANYPKGMIQYIQASGHDISSGADILFYGNIPNGAGLSYSASIEMVTGVLLENLFNLESARINMGKLGKKVENEYIGVNSGIMDQFAIGMASKIMRFY